MFWKKENENFIGKYKIDIDTCDQLIKLYKKTPLGPGGKKAGFIGNNKVDKDIKVSTDLHIELNSNHLSGFKELTFKGTKRTKALKNGIMKTGVVQCPVKDIWFL